MHIYIYHLIVFMDYGAHKLIHSFIYETGFKQANKENVSKRFLVLIFLICYHDMYYHKICRCFFTLSKHNHITLSDSFMNC